MHTSGVLILEHDERVCRVLSRIVQRLGFEALPASDYAGFKTLYAGYKPAVILLNMDTTGNDNAEFFRFLVEQQSQANIILLNDPEETETRDLMDLGKAAGLKISGILRKPIDVEAVKRMLAEQFPPDRTATLKKSHEIGYLIKISAWGMYFDPDLPDKNRLSLISV